MTRDEAIKTLKENCCTMCAYSSKGMDYCVISSCDNRDAIQVLEQEPCRDMEEIKEIMECDADIEIKYKMISNVLTAKPHYFEKQESFISEDGTLTVNVADGSKVTRVLVCGDNHFGGLYYHYNTLQQEPCEELDFVQPHKKVSVNLEVCTDAISREAAVDACLNGWNKDYKEIVAEIRALPPVTPKQSFEGMTNGEVIKAVFPECDVCDPIIEDNIIHVCFKDNPRALDAFTYTWWNEPYGGV